MKINKIKKKGYVIYHIPNKKFKTFTVGACFLQPLENDKHIENALIANMLMKYNQKYPSERILSSYLEDLYGTTLYASSSRQGLTTNITVLMNCINDIYIENCEVDIFKEATNLLINCINKPLFDEETFQIEKNLLIEDIEMVYNNKVQYATLQFLNHMYKDEMCRHSILSSYDKAKRVTLDDVRNHYNHFLASKKVFIVLGNIDESKIEEVFNHIEFEDSFDGDLEFFDLETKVIDDVVEVVEEQENNQSIVFMGYRSEIRESDELYYAMFLLNNMLGGYFHSTLFQEIREKHSLAYSVSSEYNSKKGTFVISAGISKDKYEDFKVIVSKIIKDYQDGLIDDETFNLTKKLLVNAQYKVADQQSYGVSDILHDVAKIKTFTVEEKVEIIKKITKEEVIEAAKRLQLDTIYMLKGTLQ